MSATKPHLRLAEAMPAVERRAATWRLATDESVFELVAGGKVLCEAAPWTDRKTGNLCWWAVTAGETYFELDKSLAVVMQRAIEHFGVAAQVPYDLLASVSEQPLVAPPPQPKPVESPKPLLERFADVLAAILDDPLITLPGHHPMGGPEPAERRLVHFRPDLSERAASLLEELGR